MCDKKWLEQYEKIKEKLNCKIDLDSYFSEKQIEGVSIDTIEIGDVFFPTGTVLACDPLVDLECSLPYIQKVPVGTYPVTLCVVPSETYGTRYACVKVEITQKKPVRYELAVTGKEDFEEELEEGEFFGFGVDAGMGCIADIKTQEAYNEYWKKRREAEEDIDPYNDLFCDILAESYKNHPKYQSEYGDWANWTIPETDYNLPIFQSGWGDGVYPCYFGYDKNNDLCGIYILFIDIAEDYSEQD